MPDNKRVAVVGLYRSGSTAVAGALHRLGVDMGAPFFDEYYESAELADLLRRWWNEPKMRETVPRPERVVELGRWICGREADGRQWVGAKHPLLSLCGDDLVEAWGEDTRFVWCQRPFEESVASLRRVRWWRGSRAPQRKLWDELNRFFDHRTCLPIGYADLMAHPARQIDRLCDFLQIDPTAEQRDQAVRFIEPNSVSKLEVGRKGKVLGLIRWD